MQEVFTDPRPDQRHQREAVTQCQCARQSGAFQHMQGAVCHFGGITELNKIVIIMQADRQRADLAAFKQQINTFITRSGVIPGRQADINQTNLIMVGHDLRPGAGCQHTLNFCRALFRLVTAAQL